MYKPTKNHLSQYFLQPSDQQPPRGSESLLATAVYHLRTRARRHLKDLGPRNPKNQSAPRHHFWFGAESGNKFDIPFKPPQLCHLSSDSRSDFRFLFSVRRGITLQDSRRRPLPVMPPSSVTRLPRQTATSKKTAAASPHPTSPSHRVSSISSKRKQNYSTSGNAIYERPHRKHSIAKKQT